MPLAPQRASLFLSDLHLSPTLPRTTNAFTRFIDAVDPADVAEVYILGDLFEFWIGDDMLEAAFESDVAARLATLRQRGIALYVMHGNRDFLMGRRFAHAAGATLINDPMAIDRFARRYVLTHGDLLCTDDIPYQRFRRVVRWRSLQWLFLRWPLRWRMALAARIRANSARQGGARMVYTDVNREAVQHLYRRFAADRMIQGHTHRPARHDDGPAAAPHHDAPAPMSTDTVTDIAGNRLIRWVLTDWELDGASPRAAFLRVDATGEAIVTLR
ncbi:UDP-2,3-diacylglucosamine hydrolase [Robbsia andropogonis]|uniref:UDP-2,3-diacylglucosamine diphosphatase n=1 Tax=Robbsia andropogonis TaxID=28092 RepID=UPI003D21E1F8